MLKTRMPVEEEQSPEEGFARKEPGEDAQPQPGEQTDAADPTETTPNPGPSREEEE